LPYIFVWFETAAAHVHLCVLLAGCTPGLLVAFRGVFVLQLLNLAPPGVSFDVDCADWLVFEFAEVFDCAVVELFELLELLDCACCAAFACAVAEAFALGPADELDWELSSAFFACPLFSADAETEAVTLAEV
jgi:hypothetical protein